MIAKGNDANGESKRTKENFMVQLTNPMLYDRLHTLSAEYSVSIELLVNVAVKRLIDDVDLIRALRNGEVKNNYFPPCSK